MLFIDLDGFKSVNDTHGHKAGDTVLSAVGTRLNDCTREIDTLARLGGDEFVLLTEDVADEADATTIAERLIEAAVQPVQFGDQQLRVGASIGIALTDGRGIDAEALLHRADEAMYQAKAQGGNTRSLWEVADDNDKARPSP